MIRITTTITCDYDITGNDEYKILKTEPSKDGYVHTSITDYNGKRIHGLQTHSQKASTLQRVGMNGNLIKY